MSKHTTPYSAGAIKGVLTDMVVCIRELVMDGKAVNLPDLAIFSAGISANGAETTKDFTAANVHTPLVRSARRCLPTTLWRASRESTA